MGCAISSSVESGGPLKRAPPSSSCYWSAERLSQVAAFNPIVSASLPSPKLAVDPLHFFSKFEFCPLDPSSISKCCAGMTTAAAVFSSSPKCCAGPPPATFAGAHANHPPLPGLLDGEIILDDQFTPRRPQDLCATASSAASSLSSDSGVSTASTVAHSCHPTAAVGESSAAGPVPPFSPKLLEKVQSAMPPEDMPSEAKSDLRHTLPTAIEPCKLTRNDSAASSVAESAMDDSAIIVPTRSAQSLLRGRSLQPMPLIGVSDNEFADEIREGLDPYLYDVLVDLVILYSQFFSWRDTLRGHIDIVMAVCLIDGDYVATSSAEFCKTVKIWHIDEGRLIRTMENLTHIVPNMAGWKDSKGQLRLALAGDKVVKVYEPMTGKPVSTLYQDSFAYEVVHDPYKKRIIVGSDDIRVWGSDTFDLQHIFPVKQSRYTVTSLAPLPSGNILVAIAAVTQEWDIDHHKLVRTHYGHYDSVRCVCYIGNDTFATCSRDRTVKVWRLGEEECLFTLEGHRMFVCALCLLPNGHLVSGSEDCTMKIWDLTTRECVGTIEVTSWVWGIVYTKLSGCLVAGCRNAQIRVYG